MQYCANVPNASRLRLANASVPVCCLPADGESPYTQTIDSLALVDIFVSDGVVNHIAAADSRHHPDHSEYVSVDLRRGMVLPTFVDLHTHIGIYTTVPHLSMH